MIKKRIFKDLFVGSYAPTYNAKLKNELALIFIASSHCFACNVPYLPDSVTLIKTKLQKKAIRERKNFLFICIVVDFDVN